MENKTATAKGLTSASWKHGVEIAKRIRGKPVEQAQQILQDIITMKKPIRFTVYNGGMGHKPGIGPGRYPVKASKAILDLLRNAQANAGHKGLSKLTVQRITTSNANSSRSGSRRGWDGKRMRIEITVGSA